MKAFEKRLARNSKYSLHTPSRGPQIHSGTLSLILNHRRPISAKVCSRIMKAICVVFFSLNSWAFDDGFLKGKATANALKGTYGLNRTARGIPMTEVMIDELGREVARTLLEMEFFEDATVSEVNGALKSIGAKISDMLEGSPSIVVRIPEQTTIDGLYSVIGKLERCKGIASVNEATRLAVHDMDASSRIPRRDIGWKVIDCPQNCHSDPKCFSTIGSSYQKICKEVPNQILETNQKNQDLCKKTNGKWLPLSIEGVIEGFCNCSLKSEKVGRPEFFGRWVKEKGCEKVKLRVPYRGPKSRCSG